MLGWFFVLLLAGEWMIIQIISLSSILKLPIALPFSLPDILFFSFFLFTAIAYSSALNNFVKEKTLVWYFTQPIKFYQIFFAKVLGVFWLIEGIIAIALSTMLSMIILLHAPVVIPFDFGWRLVFLGGIGSICGFAGSIFMFLKPLRKKIFFLYLFSMVYICVWYFLHELILLPILLSYALFLLFLAYKMGIEAWNNGIVLERMPKKRECGLPIIFKEKILRELARAEWLYIVRNSEHLSIPLITAFAFLGQILALNVIPSDVLKGMNAKYVYASIAGTALFISSALLSVISALSVVGKDGKAYWVIKTAPIDGFGVMMAKSYWVLLTSLISLPIVLLALPLYSLRKPPLFLFVIFGGVSSAFVSTAVGVWGAARYPDFSSLHKGSTDIVTAYNMLLLSLIINGIFLGIPLLIYFNDKFLGILSAIFSADMGALLYLTACKIGGRAYEKIER